MSDRYAVPKSWKFIDDAFLSRSLRTRSRLLPGA
jgi:hypothetical protein